MCKYPLADSCVSQTLSHPFVKITVQVPGLSEPCVQDPLELTPKCRALRILGDEKTRTGN